MRGSFGRIAASHRHTSAGGTMLCRVQGVIQTRITIISPPHKRWLNSDLWFEWPSIFQIPLLPLPLLLPISPFNKRVNDACVLISNQLFLSSFYLSLDKFSVAPAECNVSQSAALYLITNQPFGHERGNGESNGVSRVHLAYFQKEI